jgi:phosphoribosylanthranilate isomerase
MKIKLCGLTRPEDIKCANSLKPDYIGFVFAKKSKRYVSPDTAFKLKELLLPKIKAVGVFVNEDIRNVAILLNSNIIDIAQLHGDEDETYIKKLRILTDKPIIKAFKIKTRDDLPGVKNSSADYILLDSGSGSGNVFDWDLIKSIDRPFFLAGGLNPENIEEAIRTVKPFAIDVSSGIETDGFKDEAKMSEFVSIARNVSERIG